MILNSSWRKHCRTFLDGKISQKRAAGKGESLKNYKHGPLKNKNAKGRRG